MCQIVIAALPTFSLQGLINQYFNVLINSLQTYSIIRDYYTLGNISRIPHPCTIIVNPQLYFDCQFTSSVWFTRTCCEWCWLTCHVECCSLPLKSSEDEKLDRVSIVPQKSSSSIFHLHSIRMDLSQSRLTPVQCSRRHASGIDFKTLIGCNISVTHCINILFGRRLKLECLLAKESSKELSMD